MATLGLPLASVRMLPDDREVLRRRVRRGADALERGPRHRRPGTDPRRPDAARGWPTRWARSSPRIPGWWPSSRSASERSGRCRSRTAGRRCIVPSAESLPNPIGSAPGWWVDRDGAIVVLMPGVPSEMRLHVGGAGPPAPRRPIRPAAAAVRTVKAFGIGESAMAERLGSLLTSPPAGVEVGIYARDDGVHVRFSTRADALGPRRPLPRRRSRRWATTPTAETTTTSRRSPSSGWTSWASPSLASWEAGTEGALLSILATARPRNAAARFVGRVARRDDDVGPPGRGRGAPGVAPAAGCRRPQPGAGVAQRRSAMLPTTERRIHGSGPQRLRRAAFAALDAVRRISSSGR